MWTCFIFFFSYTRSLTHFLADIGTGKITFFLATDHRPFEGQDGRRIPDTLPQYNFFPPITMRTKLLFFCYCWWCYHFFLVFFGYCTFWYTFTQTRSLSHTHAYTHTLTRTYTHIYLHFSLRQIQSRRRCSRRRRYLAGYDKISLAPCVGAGAAAGTATGLETSSAFHRSVLRYFRILAFLTTILAMFLPHLCHLSVVAQKTSTRFSQTPLSKWTNSEEKKRWRGWRAGR